VIVSPQSKYWGDVSPCPIGIDAPGIAVCRLQAIIKYYYLSGLVWLSGWQCDFTFWLNFRWAISLSKSLV